MIRIDSVVYEAAQKALKAKLEKKLSENLPSEDKPKPGDQDEDIAYSAAELKISPVDDDVMEDIVSEARAK